MATLAHDLFRPRAATIGTRDEQLAVFDPAVTAVRSGHGAGVVQSAMLDRAGLSAELTGVCTLVSGNELELLFAEGTDADFRACPQSRRAQDMRLVGSHGSSAAAGIAAAARRDEVRPVVVCGVVVDVVNLQAVHGDGRLYGPVNGLAAPVAGMITGAKRVVQDHTADNDSTALTSQRMSRVVGSHVSIHTDSIAYSSVRVQQPGGAL